MIEIILPFPNMALSPNRKNGMLSISDEVFQIALWRGGYNMEWMENPPEQRDGILKQLGEGCKDRE